MNEKYFLGMDDNFEVESRMVETGTKPEMTISELSDTEKAEIFGKKVELEFSIKDALEMTR
jgi:hypothetical protein